MRRLTLLLLLLTAAGCSTQDAVVDGWPIGAMSTCAGERSVTCQRFVKVATDELDRRIPGHAVILSVELHDEGVAHDALGNPIYLTRTASVFVARLQLADGSVHAIGIADSLGDPIVIPVGP